MDCIGVNPGVWGATTPPDFGVESWGFSVGIAGGREMYFVKLLKIHVPKR